MTLDEFVRNIADWLGNTWQYATLADQPVIRNERDQLLLTFCPDEGTLLQVTLIHEGDSQSILTLPKNAPAYQVAQLVQQKLLTPHYTVKVEERAAERFQAWCEQWYARLTGYAHDNKLHVYFDVAYVRKMPVCLNVEFRTRRMPSSCVATISLSPDGQTTRLYVLDPDESKLLHMLNDWVKSFLPDTEVVVEAEPRRRIFGKRK